MELTEKRINKLIAQGDVFRIIVTVPDGEIPRDTQEFHGKTSEKTSEKILRVIQEKPKITIAELAEITGVTPRSIERNIQKLQRDGALRRVGADKGGYWEVLK